MSDDARQAAIAELVEERPDLPTRLSALQQGADQLRDYVRQSTEYTSTVGDPDLYKLFCQRYRQVLRDDGVLGVVLPRTTFITQGSSGFREWLFERTELRRIDFLINSGRWAFDSEPRYTVALVSARRAAPSEDHRVEVAGPATSASEWKQQTAMRGALLPRDAYGPTWTVPLLGTDREAELLAKVHHGSRFPFGSSGRWRAFPVRELDETNDKRFWRDATQGLPLWKGASFDQYDPHGAEERACPPTEKLWKKVHKPRAGSGSLLATELSTKVRRQAVRDEVGRARVAFHDVTQKDNSRTVIAGLIPPDVLLTNTAPYLAFAAGDDLDRAACIGIMNSLPFDWQARRFAEVHLNFFILEGLIVPDLADEAYGAVASAAARLSCVDERFADFADANDVDHGPLAHDEHEGLRAEIDAHVAVAWSLTDDDLDVMFGDFTLDAVPSDYRQRVRARVAALR